ncbi:MAG: hypothetical protein IPL61_00425 [Myxococcales bacterium]|nr:hypothetical protein [Myxococcales bacterium]
MLSGEPHAAGPAGAPAAATTWTAPVASIATSPYAPSTTGTAGSNVAPSSSEVRMRRPASPAA